MQFVVFAAAAATATATAATTTTTAATTTTTTTTTTISLHLTPIYYSSFSSTYEYGNYYNRLRLYKDNGKRKLPYWGYIGIMERKWELLSYIGFI